jgi:ATP-dependent DNA helicase RecG
VATLTRLAGIPTSEVKEIGPSREKALADEGLRSVADLLHHVPRRYLDRTSMVPIARVPLGSEVTVVGELRSITTRRPKRNLLIIEAGIADQTATISAVWFNLKHLPRLFREGMQLALSGVVESRNGKLQMNAPAYDIIDDSSEALVTGRLVPIHPGIAKISPWVLRRSIHNALTRSQPIPDPMPDVMLSRYGLMARDQAFSDIHFPESMDRVQPAHDRLAFDELFRLEVALALQKRRQMDEAAGIVHDPSGELADRFIAGLPYELTGAQKRVLGEISDDLRQSRPMHRLLQGEVGSGKTVVAVTTLLQGVEGGWQGAIMAPTEVLAEQHYIGVVGLLAEAGLSPEPYGAGSELGMDSLFGSDDPAVHVGILTGSTTNVNYRSDATRQALLDDVALGQVDILVGTHALIQEGVHFAKLGVVVVDEQHRFGVAQRVLLKEKADLIDPDLLIMTATPIPRTLAMTLYGDLDVSGIDEMPPGRTPVETKLISRLEESLAWKKIGEEVGAGRQAFVVCPLVEDSPKIEAASATAEYGRLSSLMPDLRVGLIHGQLRPSEKEAVMAAYRAAEIDVLVSTTVIEVGIDVPNATVIVIEDADRFGLSQLHQLRGRVGRGRYPGTCLLIADPASDDSEARLTAMVATTDGFRLAEEDLRIRGQGTAFGTRQSGVADLKLADILEDFDLLVAARREAFELVDRDPDLVHHRDIAEEVRAMLGDSVEWLFKS